MSLEETINTDLKTAMLKKDEPALRGLRAVKQAILMAKTSGSDKITSEDEIKMLQKLVKQRKESVEIFKQQNREDLAVTELEEIAVIEKYLPQQLSEEDVKIELKKIIDQNNAKGSADLGRIMGIASRHFAGKADNKVVSQLLKQLLG
jgi:hypothetical protein